MIREATIQDIPEIQIVRNLVSENKLSNPGLITDEDCKIFITERGKGWVYEMENRIAGFAIADLVENNIWALFLLPDFERMGIGTQLHKVMMNWYFDQTQKTVWLSTAHGTKAEKFYRKMGWIESGMQGKEIKFEMTFERWDFLRNEIFF